MGEIGFYRAFLVLGCVVAVASTAHAQPRQDSPAQLMTDGVRPWAVGVSSSEQATALELYVAGNREFIESRYTDALTKYKKAILHWDHPSIRFNMAVCLIHLDQLVEAKDNLERSLVYGDGPLGGDDRYRQGLTYRKLLDSQLARVEVSCREPGMQVTLDAKLLLACPGIAVLTILPGVHQLVATKPGFLTETSPFAAVAGNRTIYEVRPLERRTAARMARRWEVWKPWAVLVAGGALIGLGVASYVSAMNDYAAYDNGNLAACPHGCVAEPPAGYPDLRDAKESGRVAQVLAFSLASAGAAAALGGVIGVIMNQPRLKLDSSRALPVMAPIAGGVVVSSRWEF